VTDALADAELPAPEQLREKFVVAVSAALTSDPDVPFAPDHPPEAVQDVALLLFQVNVAVCPEAIDVGFALSDTITGGVGGGLPMSSSTLPPPPPPQAASKVNPANAVNKRARRENSCGICSVL
jgi:hypothetical protein